MGEETRNYDDLVNDFSKNPVNNVQWIDARKIRANDYNPNNVAPPEMKLLKLSIQTNGYTQPIVVWKVNDDEYEIVDGFHRHLVGKEMGYTHLPVVVINDKDTGREDRIAATVRHNRARGKHKIDSMSDLVVYLSRNNWSDEKIGRELGMDKDEVLRLKQVKGLAELFADQEFSEAWEVDYTDDEKIKLFSAIAQKRAEMYDNCGKNIFKRRLKKKGRRKKKIALSMPRER